MPRVVETWPANGHVAHIPAYEQASKRRWRSQDSVSCRASDAFCLALDSVTFARGGFARDRCRCHRTPGNGTTSGANVSVAWDASAGSVALLTAVQCSSFALTP